MTNEMKDSDVVDIPVHWRAPEDRGEGSVATFKSDVRTKDLGVYSKVQRGYK